MPAASTRPMPATGPRGPSGWAGRRPRWTPRATSGRPAATDRHVPSALRRQRLGRSSLSAALAPEQLFAPSDWYERQRGRLRTSDRPRRRLLPNGTCSRSASRRRLPVEPGGLGGIGGPADRRRRVRRSRRRRRRRRLGDRRLRPVRDGVEAVQTTPLRPVSLAVDGASGAARPADRGGRSGVVDRGRHALRASTRPTAPRCRRSPLGGEANHFPTPSVGDGLLLAPTPTRSSPSRARPASRGRRHHRRPRRRTPPTGWSRPTAASSPSATPASTARPAACR